MWSRTELISISGDPEFLRTPVIYAWSWPRSVSRRSGRRSLVLKTRCTMMFDSDCDIRVTPLQGLRLDGAHKPGPLLVGLAPARAITLRAFGPMASRLIKEIPSLHPASARLPAALAEKPVQWASAEAFPPRPEVPFSASRVVPESRPRTRHR